MIEFNEAKHEYIVDGVVVPSVTQITRFLHYDEASGANKWLRDEAAKKGTLIHETTVLLDYGEDIPDDFPAEHLGYIKAYQRFRRDFPKMEYKGIEKIVCCRSNDGTPLYAGTIDRWGIDENGYPFILDIKTGTKINHFAVHCQLEGYFYALNDDDFIGIDDEHFSNYSLYAIQLSKDGTYKLIDLTDVPTKSRVDSDFREMLEIHNAVRDYKGVKI